MVTEAEKLEAQEWCNQYRPFCRGCPLLSGCFVLPEEMSNEATIHGAFLKRMLGEIRQIKLKKGD